MTGDIAQIEPAYMAFIVLIIKLTISTGLSEKILFRGFIGKRLIEKLGFGCGKFSFFILAVHLEITITGRNLINDREI